MIDSPRLKPLLALSLVVMMLGMSASFGIAEDSPSNEESQLTQVIEPRSTHGGLNIPGSTAGSVYSASTVFASWNYTCVVLNTNGMKCWGGGAMGRLGDGNWDNSVYPVTVQLGNNAGISTATEVGAGLSHHTCAMMTDSTLQCWGEDWNGQNGHGSGGGWHGGDGTPVVVHMPTGRTALTVTAGGHHTCSIMDNSSLWCWGQAGSGQLGTGSFADQNIPMLVLLPTNASPIAVSAGWDGTCIILQNNTGMCTGGNQDGQLGSGTQENTSSFTPISVLPPNSNLSAISMGASHTCGLLKNGSVYCWGLNTWGQLGDNTTEPRNDSSVQVILPAGRTAIAVDSGLHHTCATLDDNSAVCWGNNEYGQIGDNTTTGRLTPTAISFPGGIGVATISAGRVHTCAVVMNGSVYCWGAHHLGQLGNGLGVDSDIPMYVNLSTGGQIHHASLGERDLDDDGILSIFDDTPYPPPVCPMGQYVVGYECIEASPGNYTPTSGMSEQFPCPAGTYQPASGQASCYDAPLGHYVPSNSSVSAMTCLAGTFQNQTGQTSCIDAPPGNYTSGDGVSEPTMCGVGLYQPLSGQTSCLASDAGHIVETEGQTEQIACEVGTYQPGTGRSDCFSAEEGHYVSQEAAIEQTECEAGTYANERGSSECKLADPGHYVGSMAAAAQNACAPGEYQPQSSQTSCLTTEAGHQNPDIGSTDMIPCEAGNYQHETGRTYCLAADPGSYVPAPAASAQIECPAGTYSQVSASTSCIDADAGYHIPESGSTDQIDCLAGTFSSDAGSSTCVNAEPGYYVLYIRATSQVACVAGSYQTEAGATGCLQADPGHYVESSAGDSQVSCSAGTYQAEAGQTGCITAPPGTYAAEESSTTVENCGPGTYQPDSGQSSCLEADAGHIVDSHGATEQIACEAGTYQSLAGQTECDTTSPGSYAASPGSVEATPCSPGTYQPMFGADSCRLASKDHFVELEGAISQTPCPSGESQMNEGQPSCVADVDNSLPILPIAVGGAVVLALVGFMLTRGKSEPEPVPQRRRRRPPEAARRKRKQLESARKVVEEQGKWGRPTEESGGEEE